MNTYSNWKIKHLIHMKVQLNIEFIELIEMNLLLSFLEVNYRIESLYVVCAVFPYVLVLTYHIQNPLIIQATTKINHKIIEELVIESKAY